MQHVRGRCVCTEGALEDVVDMAHGFAGVLAGDSIAVHEGPLGHSSQRTPLGDGAYLGKAGETKAQGFCASLLIGEG